MGSRSALALILLLAGGSRAASDTMDGDYAAPLSQAFLAAEAGPSVRGPGPIKAFFSLLLLAYRHGVSPADGPTCSFQPTCSGYAGIAIQRRGLVQGILLTGDRLMRCNGYDKSAYPMVGQERRYLDPVP